MCGSAVWTNRCIPIFPKVVRAGRIPSLEAVRIDPGHLSAISAWIFKKSLVRLLMENYMPLWWNWHTYLAKNQGFVGSNPTSGTSFLGNSVVVSTRVSKTLWPLKPSVWVRIPVPQPKVLSDSNGYPTRTTTDYFGITLQEASDELDMQPLKRFDCSCLWA